jgi:ketosteroid isomerase-like protein
MSSSSGSRVRRLFAVTQPQLITPSADIASARDPDSIGRAAVMRWIDAFNHRDLNEMLACVADAIVLHPLRLGGLRASYRGHDGVREWFAALRRQRHEHCISVTELRCVSDDQVFAAGSLRLSEGVEVASFCGLHRVPNGCIVVVHQYLSDPDMVEQLGLIP